MIEKIMSEGDHIAYTTTEKAIIFGDEDLSINIKNRERDDKVLVDVCFNKDGELETGVSAGFAYVAQVEIPAREYNEVEVANPAYVEGATAEDGVAVSATLIEKTPVAFDIDKCTIRLWAI